MAPKSPRQAAQMSKDIREAVYLQAATAAKRVQGVTRVHNHLMVDLPVTDYRDDPMLTTAANKRARADRHRPRQRGSKRKRRQCLADRHGGQPLPARRG